MKVLTKPSMGSVKEDWSWTFKAVAAGRKVNMISAKGPNVRSSGQATPTLSFISDKMEVWTVENVEGSAAEASEELQQGQKVHLVGPNGTDMLGCSSQVEDGVCMGNERSDDMFVCGLYAMDKMEGGVAKLENG